MAPTSTKMAGSKPGAAKDVGRPLDARTAKIKWKRGSLRWLFVTNFRKATADKSPDELASLLGCSPDMARKMIRGDKMPDINSWPAIAESLGLKSWTDLFKPV